MIRSDLECETRTNLPINHCAEMLTRTLRSGFGLFAQPPATRCLVLKEYHLKKLRFSGLSFFLY
ncbi:hypothetical protein D2E16_09420 [Streptococcus suis]|nr:hypothetical protein D2E16_09420 [Streptococcus suis]